MSVNTSRSGSQRNVEPVFFRSAGSFLSSPDNFAPLKVERVLKAVAPDDGVKIARGILRRARAEAV